MKKIILMISILLMLTTAVVADEMRDTWRTSFIEGCVRNNGTLTSCSCSADKLLTAFPGNKILEFSLRMIKGEMTDKDKAILLDSILTCQPKK